MYNVYPLPVFTFQMNMIFGFWENFTKIARTGVELRTRSEPETFSKIQVPH